jgi:N-acetylglucosamine malate deacetylase 2
MNERSALMAVLGAPDAEHLEPLPRTMVVVAHPDDETVGAGSRLPRLGQAQFVYVTDGAPRDGLDAARHGYTPAEYAQARRREIEAMLALCGVSSRQVAGLECPDQQAALNLAELAQKLAQQFARSRVEAVLTHSYEGGHPDHDAAAFVAHAAAALTAKRGGARPELVEMAMFHLSSEGIRACEFLPDANADTGMVTIQLTPEEQAHKRALLACFTTQRETLKGLPMEVERFRPAPRYDFAAPPHQGKLLYECHPWGMTGERFRALAAQALKELGLEGRL